MTCVAPAPRPPRAGVRRGRSDRTACGSRRASSSRVRTTSVRLAHRPRPTPRRWRRPGGHARARRGRRAPPDVGGPGVNCHRHQTRFGRLTSSANTRSRRASMSWTATAARDSPAARGCRPAARCSDGSSRGPGLRDRCGAANRLPEGGAHVRHRVSASNGAPSTFQRSEPRTRRRPFRPARPPPRECGHDHDQSRHHPGTIDDSNPPTRAAWPATCTTPPSVRRLGCRQLREQDERIGHAKTARARGATATQGALHRARAYNAPQRPPR